MKITLTKKNTGKIMQIINTFFKQPTMIYSGKKLRKISEGYVDFEKDIYIEATYEEFDEYIPQLNVTCHWHHMLKDKFFKDSPLLAISSIYGTSCIPIHEGDIIVYKGSQLIIKNLHDIKVLKLKNVSIQTFVHKNYSNEEKAELIKSKLDEYISDNIFNDDYYESIYDEECDDKDWELKDLAKEVKNSLFDVLFTRQFKDKVSVMDYKEYKINLIRNLNWFMKNGFTNSEKIEDIFKLEVIKDNEIIYNSTSYVEVAEYIYNEIHKDDIKEPRDNYDEDYNYIDWAMEI